MTVTPIGVALAALPILVVLGLMVGRRWDGVRAGLAGWVVALAVAAGAFGAGPWLLAVSQAKALFLSLFVLYIIWFALALANVVSEAGALEAVSAGLARLTSDRVMQLVILSWVFSSFVQGATGFGVPVAVVAPLLVSLGFTPVTSVVATSIGHAWSVTYGSVASAMYAMVAVTGLDALTLGPWSAGLLGVVCLLCGLLPAHVYGGNRAVRHALPAVLVVGATMAAVQYIVAASPLWSIAAFLAGLAGLAVAAGVARLPRYHGSADEQTARASSVPGTRVGLLLGLAAYLVLLAVVVIAQLVPPVAAALDVVRLAPAFPATGTAMGWANAAETGRALSVFGHAGALILYSAAISYGIYRARGCYEPGAFDRIVRATARGSQKPTAAIVLLVGMSLFMSESGMTFALAQGLSRAVGPAFPLVAPFIGALGAFITGSNTHANVLFAVLQRQTADALGLGALLILGAQNVGGGVGSVFSPAKVIVGCSTVGLTGCEGEVLRLILGYGLVILAAAGVLALVLAAVVG